MTQEEKDILLKDLSTRLPYGVKVQLSTNEVGILQKELVLYLQKAGLLLLIFTMYV